MDVGLALVLRFEVLVGDVRVGDRAVVVFVLVLGVQVVKPAGESVVVVGHVEVAVAMDDRCVFVGLGCGRRLEGVIGHSSALPASSHLGVFNPAALCNHVIMAATESDTEAEVGGWVAGRLPDDWFTGPAEVTVDREEIIIIGTLAEPETDGGAAGQAAAQAARISRFREDTRAKRMRIADETEYRYGRKVSWGARCGERTELFTTVSVPVMTRLRQPERRVLDTLVDAGVARSRSDALAWCVKLVGANESEWIDKLRASLQEVRRVRSEGPTAG